MIRRLISRIRRRLDSRYQRIPITEFQWQLMFNNMEYRDKHYWQINRGNG